MTNTLHIETLTADQGWQTIDSEPYDGTTCPEIDLPVEIGYTDQLFRLAVVTDDGETLDVSVSVSGEMDPEDRQ